VRRTLVIADAISLSLAFFLAHEFEDFLVPGSVAIEIQDLLIFLAILPMWILAAGAHGLYQRDGQRADHSTVEELVAVGASSPSGRGCWCWAPG
jgi:hypothetical protein